MKTIKKIIVLSAALLLAVSLPAASPAYVTKSGNGNATTGASVIFPSVSQQQIRLVNLNWNSDSNTATASYTTGLGAYSITATNPSSTYLTQYVNSVVGMVTNTGFILEHSGIGYYALLVATNNATNAVFGSGAFGVLSSVGDRLYQLDTAVTVPIGATTNAANGEALFVGAVGRPVRVIISPALSTNKINSAVARYE